MCVESPPLARLSHQLSGRGCVRCRVALRVEALPCALSGGLSHKRADAPTKAHWLAYGSRVDCALMAAFAARVSLSSRLNDPLKASTPHGWVDGGTCRLVGSREAVRPRTGFGEAVCGIAGWRAGAGEQGGIGSIPHNTRAHKFYKTADCLRANT